MIYLASCPICGRILGKGTPSSHWELGCPKCGEYIALSFSETGVTAVVSLPLKKAQRPSTIPYAAEIR
ncbi:MAG: hypothetical protein E7618_02405 [Ruminococcaceae bacterium]|nr:hypothetical protein [Oscillospiraceae bacterium]